MLACLIRQKSAWGSAAERSTRVATIDPDDGAISVYRNGRFGPLDEPLDELLETPTPPDWRRGKWAQLTITRARQPACRG